MKSQLKRECPDRSAHLGRPRGEALHRGRGAVPYTAGPCSDGARGDTPGEFTVEHRNIFVKPEETLRNLYKTLMKTGVWKVQG